MLVAPIEINPVEGEQIQTEGTILLDYKLLGIGSMFFVMGWLVQKFGLNN